MQRIGRGMKHLAFRVLSSMSRPVKVFGVELRDLTERVADERAVDRVRQALKLIFDADPTLSRSIQEQLRRVFLTRTGTVDYVLPLKACLLPIRELENQSAAHLAMTLVHQARRAQLLRSSVPAAQDFEVSADNAALNDTMAFARMVQAPPEDIIAFRMRHTYAGTYRADPERPFDDLKSLGIPTVVLRALRRLRDSSPQFREKE